MMFDIEINEIEFSDAQIEFIKKSRQRLAKLVN